MLRFIFLILFFTTVRSFERLKDTELTKKVCEAPPNYPGQLLILTFSCNNGKIIKMVQLPDILQNINLPNLLRGFFIISILLCIVFIGLLVDQHKSTNKLIEESTHNIGLLVNEVNRTVGLNNAQFPDNVRFSNLLKLDESNDLEAESETTSIIDIYIDKHGTMDYQPPSTLKRGEAFTVSSVAKQFVHEISSNNLYLESSNILLKTPNETNEYSSSQHDSGDESESNTMGDSALVENKNDSWMKSPKRRRNILQKSKQVEKNLSRSVSQESIQSNYSFSTAPYSSVRLSENEFPLSVNAFSSLGKTSSAYDLLPNVHEKRNEPSYHQETWEHRGSQIGAKNYDAFFLHESTVIRSRRHTVIGINGEWSKTFENLCLNQVNKSCRKSISSYQQSYDFLTASHEDISQFSPNIFVPNESTGTNTPLSVVFARMDEALRNIGRIRSVRNEGDQSSERSISTQSDYSFSTASLRSDDFSSLGSSVNSSNSDLSDDSGITNSRSDVEDVIND